MKVFYATSFYGKEKYQEEYAMIIKTIQQTNVDLLTPDGGTTLKILKLQSYAESKSKKKLHYEAIKRGINWAHIVILEASHEDFQLGHEASIAVNTKKPVLCLSIHEDFSKKINSPYFFGAKYNSYTVDEIVINFINKYNKENLTERFNLFISPRQLKSLEKGAKEMGMNNSEYLRWLIDNN